MGKEENVYGTPRDKLDLWQQAGRCVCYGQRGIDFLYGVPRDKLDLWQQAGRCAHYGQRGIVYLYKINSSSCKDDNLKALLNEPTECLRRTILKDFVLSSKVSVDDLCPCSSTDCRRRRRCRPFCWCHKCSCCSYCKDQCSCKGKMADMDLFEEVLCSDL